MSERKVLNKYIPPDFDPERMAEKKKLLKRIEKRKNKEKNKYKAKKNLMNIRMMYPFTLQCGKCKAFTYVGTKFNSRVEKATDEHYLNMPIWRFYGKCSECRNEIIFKTDPKNGDYVLVSGGVRTYDANKEQEIADDFCREKSIMKEEDKIENTEKQSYNALMELRMNEQIDELKNINRRNLDKMHSINKALSHLYEKNKTTENKDCFYMNNLDPEDEKVFFNLISKRRTIGQYNEIEMPKQQANHQELIEEVQEEVVEVEEKEKEENDLEKELKLLKLNKQKKSLKESNDECTEQKVLKKGNSGDGIICSNRMENDKNDKNDKNDFYLKNKFVVKKKNLASEYNFVVTKKENICSMLDEYNSSDSSDEFDKE